MKIISYILLMLMIPAIGFASTFGTTSSSGLTIGGGANILVATKYTLPEPALLSNISIFTMTGYSGNVKVGIYSDATGTPGSLLVSTTVGSAVSSNSWANISITPTNLPSGVYWIASIDDSTSLRGRKAGATNQACYKIGGTYAAGLPSSFTPTGYQSTDYVCYGTYSYQTVIADGNYIDIINGAATVVKVNELTLQGNYLDIYNGNATIPIITNSTTLIKSVPAYNEVNGEWTESFIAQGNYIDIYNGNISDFGKVYELILNGNYLDIFNGTITELTRITNSTTLIETAPAYNAVDGAWVETVYGVGNYIDIYNGIIPDLLPPWIEADFNYVDIFNHNLGTVKWQDGIEYAPGAEWYNDELTYISGGTSDESVDMITFGGF